MLNVYQVTETGKNNRKKIDIFTIEPLINIISSYLDKKSYIEFKNICKSVNQKISKRFTIYNNINPESSKVLSKIKNVRKLQFNGDIELKPIFEAIDCNLLNEIIIYGNKSNNCICLSGLMNLKVLKIITDKINLDFLKNLPSLESLSIYFNPLLQYDYHKKYYDKDNYIINFIKDLKKLIFLDISRTVFNSLEQLSSLTFLEELDLSECTIIKGYNFLSNFINLKKLNLFLCNISDISCFKELKELIELNISSCQRITDFSHMKYLKSLQTLRMNDLWYKLKDDFIDIVFLEKLNKLRFLNISTNILKNSITISYLKELRILIMDNIQAYDISFLESLINLIELNLQWNTHIKSFQPISKLTKLEKLVLNNTNLTDITFIKPLKKLQNLDISDNKGITDFKPIEKLSKLNCIDLKGSFNEYLFENEKSFDELLRIFKGKKIFVDGAIKFTETKLKMIHHENIKIVFY